MAKRLRWYLAELKRRKVYRVAVAYAVVAFVVWQVADIAFPGLGLPDAAVSLVLVLSILGFPVALVLAWAYEIAPEPVPGEGSPAATDEARISGAPESPEAGGMASSAADAHPGASEAREGSIAVLPFENLSSEADSEFFADGVTEEITHTLAQFRGLRVVARTSAFAFKGRAADIREVARKLDVSHVLEGSVRRFGGRLRITAQLVDARGGFHLWSERYDRDLDDVFAIQEEIASEIAGQLSARLSTSVRMTGPGDEAEDVRSRSQRRPTDDLAAYDAYLRGRHQRAVFDPASLETAVRRFREAVELDPDFAEAHAALAESYSAQAIGLGFTSRETMPRARDAADRALALAPHLADAHLARALVALFYDRDYERAKQGLDRALELNPNFADAWLWSELYWTYVGCDFDAAVAATTRAQELSPVDPSVKARLGYVYLLFGHHDRAIDYFGTLIAEGQDHPLFHLGLGDTLVRCGAIAEGAGEAERALALMGSDRAPVAILGVVGGFRALSGDEEGARALLARLEEARRTGFVTAFWRGHLHAGLGDMEAAFDCLDEALEERDCNLVYLCAIPEAFGLRDDPRFPALVERLGLPCA
ncbi:MAG: hypothetical protein R3266_02825 [Gemmatimonadota bacterium]|nr:hypothetical protein [Gemmatimonadota bacterium]